MNLPKTLLSAGIFLYPLTFVLLSAAPSPYDLSFENLQNVRIVQPASITRLTPNQTPAAVTSITSDQIEAGTARNIYDLIESHTPGAIWINHEEGPALGIRGNIADRNYGLLTLFNGRSMNNKAYYGARSELEMIDLNDIKEIQVIRGPGSVTYGPGAIAGVINIIPHNAVSAPGLRISPSYNHSYDSKGISASYGHITDSYDFYSYFSIVNTKGYKPRMFLGSGNNIPGYVGEDINITDQPLDYFADYDDDPQIKFYTEANLRDKFKFWMRYTQQGSTWHGNETKSNFNNRLLNRQGGREKQATIAIEREGELNNKIRNTTLVSLSSTDSESRKDRVVVPDPNHPVHYRTNFAEHEFFLKSIFDVQLTSKIETGIGLEWSHRIYGPGWGDHARDMRLGGSGIVISGNDSLAYGTARRFVDPNTAISAGTGWHTDVISALAETKYVINKKNTLLLSGRMDKNTYYDKAIAYPRLAHIHHIKNSHYLKASIQRSVRTDPDSELYIQQNRGIATDKEALDSVEISYTGNLTDNLLSRLSLFYNDRNVRSFNGDTNTVKQIGNSRVAGFESELAYDTRYISLGANYAFTKQIEWQGSERNAVSYSDYLVTDSGNTFSGAGNDLNNWPNHAFKVFGQWKPTKRIIFHTDMRALWGYQGAKDGLETIRNTVAGTANEGAFERSMARLNSVGAYELNLRANASMNFYLKENLSIQFMIQNLLGKRSKRYAFDSGNNKTSPQKLRFIEEKRAYGLNLKYTF